MHDPLPVHLVQRIRDLDGHLQRLIEDWYCTAALAAGSSRGTEFPFKCAHARSAERLADVRRGVGHAGTPSSWARFQRRRVDRARTLLSTLQLTGPPLDRPARDVARAEAESQRDRNGDGTEQASEGEIDDLVR